MSLSSVSTLSIQQMLTSQLQAQNVALTQVALQLATGKQHSNLTDYAPSDALNLMNMQNGATQSQAYIGVINTVQTRLSGYDATMTDMESIVAQAQSMAIGNPSYNASTVAGIASMATNFLQSVGIDLNQQIGGRYIYGGSRYDTPPVKDLTSLAQAPSTTIYTDGKTLPIYDAGYSASALTMGISGQTVTIGGTVGSPQNANVTVNGKTYSYAVQPSDTATTIATGLVTLIGADIAGTSSLNGVLTIGGTNPPTAAAANVTNTAAYAADSATIGTNYTVPYGISSNNPAFQQMIAGLRYMQAAGNATDAATYKADMTQATALLTTATTTLSAVHTGVANNINTLTQEIIAQKAAISSLTTQTNSIQSVDLTQVSAEVTLMQTQLQASFSVTGTLEKMTIVGYL